MAVIEGELLHVVVNLLDELDQLVVLAGVLGSAWLPVSALLALLVSIFVALG